MSIIEKIHQWVEVRLGIDEIVKQNLTGYLLPRTINVWYSMGSVLIFAFVLQVISGILLLIYYVPDAEKAFKSVSYIMNYIPYGYLIRMGHAIGSNMMVAVLFLHMLSVLFMGSYKKPRELNWLTGFILFVLALGISLTGYLLPWSQLSFWATTVATTSMGAIPFVGDLLVEFMRGGKLVGPATLGRFFALHVAVLPAVIALFIAGHIFCLKRTGISAPPFGVDNTKVAWSGEYYSYEKHHGGIPFFPHYFLHDMVSISVYCAIFAGLVLFNPFIFFTPDAFVPANPLQTPPHIKPEWYFLANYQILKIFPNELLGLLVQMAAAGFLALLPFIDRSDERHPLKRPLFLAVTIGGIITYIGLSVWGHYS